MIDTPFFDAHTHHLPQPQITAIVSCRMDEKTASSYLQATFISASLHPWYLTEENIQPQIDWLVQTIQSDSRVVALGETGLDKVCDTPFDLQIQAFKKVIEISETYHLPLVIHSVKATEELLALHKEYHPAQAWIIHGFRGKKDQEKALSIVPADRFLLESDEADTDFPDFYRQVASLRGTSFDSLIENIKENANRLFFNR